MENSEKKTKDINDQAGGKKIRLERQAEGRSQKLLTGMVRSLSFMLSTIGSD